MAQTHLQTVSDRFVNAADDFLKLSVRLVRHDALRHVLPEVVVEERAACGTKPPVFTLLPTASNTAAYSQQHCCLWAAISFARVLYAESL